MPKRVSFYSNTPDDTHCFQAALRMVLKYFMPAQEYDFEKLDEMTDKKDGLWTWPIRGIINLHKMGFQIIDDDYVDLDALAKDPTDYLVKRYGKEVGEAQIKNSDLDSIVTALKEYEILNIHRERIPTLEEIKSHIDNGYLVICNINSHVLSDIKGYAGHFVVIYDYDQKGFWLHDPGLPPIESRYVSFEKFTQSWEYPDERSKNILALRLKNYLKN